MKRRSNKPIYKRAWNSLTSDQIVTRKRALEVLRQMRLGRSLTAISRAIGIDRETAKGQLGNAIYRRKGRWRARRRDRIERSLNIYEDGRIQPFVTRNSDIASLIGQYLNDVKKVLSSGGDPKLLNKYKKLVLRDSKGKKHKLETNIDRIKLILQAMEDIEFGDYYTE